MHEIMQSIKISQLQLRVHVPRILRQCKRFWCKRFSLTSAVLNLSLTIVRVFLLDFAYARRILIRVCQLSSQKAWSYLNFHLKVYVLARWRVFLEVLHDTFTGVHSCMCKFIS